jgi:hypothetical protein
VIAAVRARWRGEAPLGTVFWTEMLCYGTALNVATTLGALLALVSGGSGLLAAAVHFSPAPVNLFLLVAVWRSAEAAPVSTAGAVRLAAFLWFVAAMAL